jgi:hypothetical protein
MGIFIMLNKIVNWIAPEDEQLGIEHRALALSFIKKIFNFFARLHIKRLSIVIILIAIITLFSIIFFSQNHKEITFFYNKVKTIGSLDTTRSDIAEQVHLPLINSAINKDHIIVEAIDTYMLYDNKTFFNAEHYFGNTFLIINKKDPKFDKNLQYYKYINVKKENCKIWYNMWRKNNVLCADSNIGLITLKDRELCPPIDNFIKANKNQYDKNKKYSEDIKWLGVCVFPQNDDLLITMYIITDYRYINEVFNFVTPEITNILKL